MELSPSTCVNAFWENKAEDKSWCRLHYRLVITSHRITIAYRLISVFYSQKLLLALYEIEHQYGTSDELDIKIHLHGFSNFFAVSISNEGIINVTLSHSLLMKLLLPRSPRDNFSFSPSTYKERREWRSFALFLGLLRPYDQVLRIIRNPFSSAGRRGNMR